MSFIRDMRRKLQGWWNREEETTVESRQSANRKTTRRYRRAAERLFENSSLRDELNDDQAKRLLDWGSEYLKKVVNDTAELADEDADNILEAQTERVTGVMRQVNRLTRAMTGSGQEELAEHIKSLRNNLDGLRETPAHVSADLEDLMASSKLEREEVFETLMNLLDGEEE